MENTNITITINGISVMIDAREIPHITLSLNDVNVTIGEPRVGQLTHVERSSSDFE